MSTSATNTLTDMDTKFYCTQCGSYDIQVRAWYDPNTDKVGEFCEDTNYDECWCEDCMEITTWDTKIVTTQQEAKNIILEDDDTLLGGTSEFGETLAEFMESAQIPYTASIEDIDDALIECGIKQVFKQCS